MYIEVSEVPKIFWTPEKGSILQERRNSRNWTLEVFVEKLADHGFKYSKAYISQFEVGKAKAIKPELLMAFCEVLETNISDFVKAKFLSQ